MNCEAHSRSAMCGSGGALDSGQVFPPDLRPRGIASGWGRRRPLPDALVTREIQQIPNFFDPISGRFDKKLYQETLGRANLTPARFERSAAFRT